MLKHRNITINNTTILRRHKIKTTRKNTDNNLWNITHNHGTTNTPKLNTSRNTNTNNHINTTPQKRTRKITIKTITKNKHSIKSKERTNPEK